MSLSTADAHACSGDNAASCISASFKADLAHTASYVFDWQGTSVVDLPLLKALALFLGIEIPLYIPLPATPVPACSLFAMGSMFRVEEKSPGGISNNILEFTYTGQKNESQFPVKTEGRTR